MKKFKHYWMCMKCAKGMGGVFPPGHVCTCILVTCPYCKGENHKEGDSIIPYVDFDWPNDKETDRYAKQARD